MLKTTKQVYFNQVKGVIEEINDVSNFPSITLVVGHTKKRHVNLILKKEKLDEITSAFKVGDTIALKFFVSSRFKHERWYTMVNVLEIIE